MSTIDRASLRFGPGDDCDGPCGNPEIIECAAWECQNLGHCRLIHKVFGLPQESAKVTSLKPEVIKGSFAPVPELIEEIEKLLASAKAGEMRAAAWAVVYHDGHAPDAAVASGWARGPYTTFAMTAAIDRLKFYWSKEQWK